MTLLMNLYEELKTIQEHAGFYEASQSGQILITGPDSPAFLHRLLSNEVKGLKTGEGRYQGFLDRKAKVLSLFYLIRLGEQEFLSVSPPQLAEKTKTLFVKMKFIEKIVLADQSEERTLFFVVGSRADVVIKNLFQVSSEVSNQLHKTSDETLFWKEDIFKVPVWNISVRKEARAAVLEKLSGNIQALSETSLRLLQMESGFPQYGVDLGEDHILLEAALPYTYQRQKGCYPGQEVIERILAYGKGKTPERLCMLHLDEELTLQKGQEIFSESGEKAGAVTSALYHPLKQHTVILAYLQQKYAEKKNLRSDQAGRLILSEPN